MYKLGWGGQKAPEGEVPARGKQGPEPSPRPRKQPSNWKAQFLQATEATKDKTTTQPASQAWLDSPLCPGPLAPKGHQPHPRLLVVEDVVLGEGAAVHEAEGGAAARLPEGAW